MSDNGLPPGWYTSEEGHRRYWDGETWSESDSSTLAEEVEASGGEETLPVTQKPVWRRTPVLIAAGAAIVLVVAAVAVPVGLFLSGADRRAAESQCQQKLVDSLKSPTTAELSEVRVLDEVEYVKYLVDKLHAMVGLGEDADAEGVAELMATAKEKQDKDAAKGIHNLNVVGLVDSQNGFGAMIRNEWVCEIEFTEGSVTDGPDITSFDEPV